MLKVVRGIALLLAAVCLGDGLCSTQSRADEDSWQRTQRLVEQFQSGQPLTETESQQLRDSLRPILEPLRPSSSRVTVAANGSSAATFAISLLIGSTLLIAGLAYGFWSGLRRAKRNAPPEGERLVKVLSDLFEWTNGFAGEVSQYRQLVDGVSLAASAEPQSGTPDTAKADAVVKRMLSANQRLKERLDTAETTLKKQSSSLAEYLAEARTDALTKLPNRRAFDEEMTRRLSEWRRHRKPLSILLVDIDHFKLLNDRHGHQAGDAVLSHVSAALRQTMRDSDLVTRYGGEEFAIVLSGTVAAEAAQAATRVRLAIEQLSVPHEGQPLQVTVSGGAAQARVGESVAALVRRADAALYASKKSGRNNAHWHDGTRCIRIGGVFCSIAKDAPSDDIPPEFQAVCVNLRRRLQTVLDSESAVRR